MEDCTLLMPFLAREEGYDLCLKVLSFYKGQGCDGNILIALTGDEAERLRFKDLLCSCDYSGRLYEHKEGGADLLGIHVFYEKMLEAAKAIQTEYVTIISADDFTLPDAIAQACQVLEQDRTVSACSGRGFLHNPRTGNVAIYPQTSRMEQAAGERLSLYMRKPTALFYSTYRTLDLVGALEKTFSFLREHEGLLKRNISFSEHIFSFFVITTGRLYVQDALYFIRLQNPQQAGRRAPSMLASYILGDADLFIRACAEACGHSLSDIRDSYKEYIYAKGAYNPQYALKNIRLSLRNPLRAVDLFWNSLRARMENERPTWALDDVHQRDQNSIGYQTVMRHLL